MRLAQGYIYISTSTQRAIFGDLFRMFEVVQLLSATARVSYTKNCSVYNFWFHTRQYETDIVIEIRK